MKQESIQFKANLFHTRWHDKPKFEVDWTVRYIGHEVEPVWSVAMKTYRRGKWTFKAFCHRAPWYGTEMNEFVLDDGRRMWCDQNDKIEQIT